MAVGCRLGGPLIGLFTTVGTAAAMLAAAGPATAAAGPAGGSSPAARAVTLTASGRAALARLYASYRGIPRGDIAGIRPGTVHAAYQPSERTEWATASFLPALKAPVSVLLRFQDGASTIVFIRPDGGRWRIVRAGGEPLSCRGVLPAGLQRVWRLTSRAGCAAAP